MTSTAPVTFVVGVNATFSALRSIAVADILPLVSDTVVITLPVPPTCATSRASIASFTDFATEPSTVAAPLSVAMAAVF